ncbi:hypothetical protein CKO40_08095 [Halochromatium glycolicum]|uniref:N6 adenine-specific DNA methyltransferase N-terminal domain-containing protein n=1 Tax=Halochromatium glycolicum TaxID=85075 RepID=A0AAJ0U3A2_9GAMM|nr:hypothetical protein [Halochromatium glycolicum]
MLSPQLRKHTHGLWSRFWSVGISNPLIAIQQITYLLFIRELEALDGRRTKRGEPSIYASGPDRAKAAKGEYEHCRWSYIRERPSFALLNDTVFPWLRWLETGLAQGNGDSAKLQDTAGRLKDAYFILAPNKTDSLTRSVKDIDELFDDHNLSRARRRGPGCARQPSPGSGQEGHPCRRQPARRNRGARHPENPRTEKGQAGGPTARLLRRPHRRQDPHRRVRARPQASRQRAGADDGGNRAGRVDRRRREDLLRARGEAARAGRLDRWRRDQDRLRDQLHPLVLQAETAAHAGRDSRGHRGGAAAHGGVVGADPGGH